MLKSLSASLRHIWRTITQSFHTALNHDCIKANRLVKIFCPFFCKKLNTRKFYYQREPKKFGNRSRFLCNTNKIVFAQNLVEEKLKKNKLKLSTLVLWMRFYRFISIQSKLVIVFSADGGMDPKCPTEIEASAIERAIPSEIEKHSTVLREEDSRR